MPEGLFSPSHLVIIAIVVFVVIGPRKIANRWHHAGQRLRQLGDDETRSPREPDVEPQRTPAPSQPSRSAAYRLGRRFRRRQRD